MHHVVSDDLAEDYASILLHVREHGTAVAPRGQGTREILSFTLELRDPRRALPFGTGRKIHMGIAAAEALQVVGGFSDPAAMSVVSPHMDKYLDGGVFHAPYGARAGAQVAQAIERLKQDPDTRKAYIALWDPAQDMWTMDTRNHPCVTSIQFMIRDNRLNMHLEMRANDAWHGFPYDIFMFAQLQLAMANVLQIEAGVYYHHATSFHLYDEHLDRVDDLISASSDPLDGVCAHIDPERASWADTQCAARGLFYGTAGFPPVGEGERKMWNALRKAGVTGTW